MPQYVFPAEFLFWITNPWHKTHKDALLPKVRGALPNTADTQVGKWCCDVNTEYFNSENNVEKYLDLITQAVYPALDQMFSEVPGLLPPVSSRVKKIWYNHYEPTGHTGQEVHMHAGSNFSGIYFLQLDEPNTTIFFSHTAAANPVTNCTKGSTFIEEGDILLFPSNLMHYVLPSTKPRTTIAFNVSCQYEN